MRRSVLPVFCSLLILIISVIAGCAPKIALQNTQAAPPTLAEHSKLFNQRIEKVTDHVYCAIGYALSNVAMVIVDGGKVIIDTTESANAAAQIKEEFDKIAPGPVLAVFYTHTHPDHVLGTSVFIDESTQIWAHSRAVQSMNDQFASLGAVIRYRGAKQYGEQLPKKLVINNGLGPFLKMDEGPIAPLVYPTHTFNDQQELTFGGVKFMLQAAFGETHDQILVWLPDDKVLFPGDNIYQAFPNLYSTRGVPPRPVRDWILSLDKMRKLDAEYLVPGHTGVIKGSKQIYDTLTVYRDAIRYVHDEVIRMAIAGKNPDDMAESIQLPPHLKNHPYLQEFYGKVSWSVRGIYDGYLGWFDGNPAHLSPLHPREKAKRMLPLLGGRDKLLAEIQSAISKQDMQWAVELIDTILDVDPDDKDAKLAKAEALWWLGLRSTNPNERCFLLSSAMELRGKFKAPGIPQITSETVRDVPVEVIIKTFPERIRVDKTNDINKVIGFQMTDTGKEFTFFIRYGVGEVSEARTENTNLRFIATESDFKAFLIGELAPAKALSSKRVVVEGGLSELMAFKSYLIK